MNTPKWIYNIEKSYKNCENAIKRINTVLETKELTEENRKELEMKREAVINTMNKLSLKLKKAKIDSEIWYLNKDFEENPFITCMKSWEDDTEDYSQKVREFLAK